MSKTFDEERPGRKERLSEMVVRHPDLLQDMLRSPHPPELSLLQAATLVAMRERKVREGGISDASGTEDDPRNPGESAP